MALRGAIGKLIMRVYNAARPRFIGPLFERTELAHLTRMVPIAYTMHTFPVQAFAAEQRNFRHNELRASIAAFAVKFDLIVETLAGGEFENFEGLPTALLDDFVPVLWTFVKSYNDWKEPERLVLLNAITMRITTCQAGIHYLPANNPHHIAFTAEIERLTDMFNRLM